MDDVENPNDKGFTIVDIAEYRVKCKKSYAVDPASNGVTEVGWMD